MALTKEEVAKLYVATFNRAPDSAGLDYWMNDSAVSNLDELAVSMLASQEAAVLYPAGTTNEDFVASMYQNMFNRYADTDGLAYWVEQLEAGNVSRNVMIKALIDGAAADTGSADDKAVIENKTTVGLSFADAGLDDVESAKSIMAEVNKNASSVTLATAQITNAEAAKENVATQESNQEAAAQITVSDKTDTAANFINGTTNLMGQHNAIISTSGSTPTIQNVTDVDALTTGTVTAAHIHDTDTNFDSFTSTQASTWSTTQITFTNAASHTAVTGITQINLTTGTNSVTLGTVDASITGVGGDDTVVLNGTTAYTGTLALAGGTNVLTAVDGTNLAGATVSATAGTVTMNLAGAYTVDLGINSEALTAITGTNSSEGTIDINGAGTFDWTSTLVTQIDTITFTDSTDGTATLQLQAADLNETMTITGDDAGTSAITLSDTYNASADTITLIDTITIGGADQTLTIDDDDITSTNFTTITGSGTSNLVTTEVAGATDLRNTTISGFDEITLEATNSEDHTITLDAASLSNAAAFTLTTGDGVNLAITEDDDLSLMTITSGDVDSIVLSAGVDLTLSQLALSTSIASITGDGAGTETVTIGASAATSALDISNITTITNLNTLIVTDGTNGTGVNAITLSTTDAVRAITTVALATDSQADTITFGANTIAGGANAATITGFTVGAGGDQLQLDSDDSKAAVASGGNTAITANDFVEITGTTATLSDVSAGGSVDTVLEAALDVTGMTDGEDFYALVYGAGNTAGLYHVDVTDATGGASEEIMTIELIGTFNSITADSFDDQNNIA